MAKRALTWRRAAAIAWRDLKSAPGKFAFVVLSFAVGVAALVGVRGFSRSFRHTLSIDARSLLAGDLSARIYETPTAKDKSRIATALGQPRSSIQTTWVTDTVSMASVPPNPVPLLVSLKAVNPDKYPFYGHVELQPAMTLKQALAGNSVAVAEEFLIRMNAHVGQTLHLGTKDFTIAAVIAQEPDRVSSGMGLGPRVMISNASLSETGLLGPGSRAARRLLLKVPADADLPAVRKELETALPDAEVMDYKEGSPALNRGLNNATAILSLICLVAMVLGAIGVAMAMHAHLEQRMDMLAILKAVGAGSGDLLRIFLLQTLALGLAGGVLGVIAGVAVMAVLPAVFGNLLRIPTQLEFPWSSMAAGLGTGLLTTLLFCLPPLLDVRHVRPVLILRRLVERGGNSIGAFIERWAARWLQLVVSAAVVLALGGIAWGLSDSAMVGGVFAGIFSATLASLLLLSAITLIALRLLLKRIRLRLPSSLRHGLANLYRPGNQSAAVLAALGAGVMLILAVYLMQSQLLADLHETASPELPNVFLVDISPDQVQGVKSFFEHQPGIVAPLNLLPVVTGRFISVDGTPVVDMKGRHFPRRMLESARLTPAETPPAGDKVVEGKWWSDPDAAEIAVSEDVAKRLQLHVGSPVELELDGVIRKLKVAALYRADGQHLGARVSFAMPPGQVREEAATWYGGVHIQPALVATMERGLYALYPTITVVNIADVLDRIESVVNQITFVVRFLAAFSILAGLMILASSIASTRFRRTREAVVLKTLGATRMRIVRTFSVEFSVLGLLAGAVGAVFANVLAQVLLRKLDVHFHVLWGATAVALLGTAVLATATGWIASYRILGLRPLEVLREE
jgi:putative ABC transport system permease protein